MKVALHILAAVIGLAIAALIVFLVFGSASEHGATTGSGAPAQRAGAAADGCGSIAPGDVEASSSLAAAAEHLPAIISETGVEVMPTKDDQRAWFARVQAAGGLCVDEIRVPDGAVVVSMSTTDDVSGADASAYALGVVRAAFAKPLDRPLVRLETFVGEERRSAVVSRSAFAQFESQRSSLRLPNSMEGLASFRRATAFPASELRLVGWSSAP